MQRMSAMWLQTRHALLQAGTTGPIPFPTHDLCILNGLCRRRRNNFGPCLAARANHRWSISRTQNERELNKDDKGESDVGSPAMRRVNEGANITLKDIPQGMRGILLYKCLRQPVQVLIGVVTGKKGVDRGLLNCLQMHFRTHEIVRCRISKQWTGSFADMAQELEEKSGGVIIQRDGSRVCLFRGYTDADIPQKAQTTSPGWWETYQKPTEPSSDTE